MDETTLQPASTTRAVRRPPSPRGSGSRTRLHWPYAVLSLLIGALLWFGVDLYRMREKTLDVDIEYESLLPADWRFTSMPVRTVKVTVRGPNQAVENLSREQITLEPEYPRTALEGDSYDGGLTLMPTFVHNLPAGVSVVAIQPPIINIRLSKLITRYINVEAGEIVGTPQEGYAVGRINQIDPVAMPISASREFLSKITSTDVIRTKPFSVEGGRGLVGGMVELEPFEKDGVTVDVPGFVYMTVELDEIPAERRFEQPFEVRALVDAPFDRYGKLNLSPPSVVVTASGPKTVIDRLTASEITIYADMKDRIPAAPGEFNIKLKAITPSRVRVARIEPDTVKWLAEEATASGAPASTTGSAAAATSPSPVASPAVSEE